MSASLLKYVAVTRYWSKETGYFVVLNVLGDGYALVTSQSSAWFADAWLDTKYFPQIGASIAAVVILAYNILWSLVEKAPAYKNLSRFQKHMDAGTRIAGTVLIWLAFRSLGNKDMKFFVLYLGLSFIAVLLWNTIVPTNLRRQRGLLAHDIFMACAAALFCWFTYKLYITTDHINDQLYTVQLNRLEYQKFMKQSIGENVDSIVFVACSTTAMALLLASAFLTVAREHSE